MKIQHLPPPPTINVPLVEFINILAAFYHLPTSLVLLTHSLIDAYEYAQADLN